MDQASRSPGGVSRTRRAAQRPRGEELPRVPPRRRQGPWVRRALIFATCVLMLDALFGDRGLAERVRAREVFQQAEADLARMRQENAGLRDRVRRLREDPDTIESVARAELGMIRPGEILVVVRNLR